MAKRPRTDAAASFESRCAAPLALSALGGHECAFRRGEKASKVGPFDGHLGNADNYDEPTLEDVAYRRRR